VRHPASPNWCRCASSTPCTAVHGVTVPLRWEAIGAAGGLFPVLDADLILAAEGQDKTVIAFVRGLRSTTPETRGRMESAS
jgi:hypothetical protein